MIAIATHRLRASLGFAAVMALGLLGIRPAQASPLIFGFILQSDPVSLSQGYNPGPVMGLISGLQDNTANQAADIMIADIPASFMSDNPDGISFPLDVTSSWPDIYFNFFSVAGGQITSYQFGSDNTGNGNFYLRDNDKSIFTITASVGGGGYVQGNPYTDSVTFCAGGPCPLPPGSPPMAGEALPEPASFALLGIGVLGIVVASRWVRGARLSGG